MTSIVVKADVPPPKECPTRKKFCKLYSVHQSNSCRTRLSTNQREDVSIPECTNPSFQGTYSQTMSVRVSRMTHRATNGQDEGRELAINADEKVGTVQEVLIKVEDEKVPFGDPEKF